MSANLSAVLDGRVLNTRPGSSRKLLARKARERSAKAQTPALEDSFPTTNVLVPIQPPAIATDHQGTCDSGQPGVPETVVMTSTVEARPAIGKPPATAKAGRVLRPGNIPPNPGTIVAAIVRLVVERGELSTAELVGLMASSSFTHPKARPTEKGWSQGYVAGAIRNGFLAVAAEPSLAADASSAPSGRVSHADHFLP